MTWLGIGDLALRAHLPLSEAELLADHFVQSGLITRTETAEGPRYRLVAATAAVDVDQAEVDDFLDAEEGDDA